MIHFGKDGVESQRRSAVLQTGYAALCCAIGAPALLVMWHFRQGEWFFLVLSAVVAVGGVVAILKCINAGTDRTPCDCEERDAGR
ncbi:MAG: hypothetical protein ACK4JY_03860 [Brevundimonas sp.]|uniref:hypothetical protein n=1 Tax=Brevundimonas sp. TaxID=1871086 RepID=UPI00391ABA02